MNKVRLGVIGFGNMGYSHAKNVIEGKIKECELTAVCDVSQERMVRAGDSVRKFTDVDKMFDAGIVDAILIATPHYDHTTAGIKALKKGLHVLVEKPISVHKADCQKLIAAHKRKKQVFAAMFNQRTDPHYTQVREVVQDGRLGKLMRVNWIITNWFRSELYYSSGQWRATWGGEGGGVLLNQCPHNLDLLQWICGMPSSVRAFCHFGKWHDIEVEDEVTACLEYRNGATGVFVASTGEAPGSNRLEIMGENGKIVVESGKVTFTRNKVSAIEFCKKSKELFKSPEAEEIPIVVDGNGPQHVGILQNFVDAILHGAKLIAPAHEGIHSVELANAMLLSTWTNDVVKLPMSGRQYAMELQKRIRSSMFRKKVAKDMGAVELKSSFGKA